MSVELERAYAKLAEKAETHAIPSLSGVLRRGRQRRRRSLTTAMSAVTVLAVLGGVYLLQPQQPPSHDLFLAVGEPVLRYAAPATFAMTQVVGDRAYAMWLDTNEQEWIGVVDLKTGQAPWQPVSLGRFGDTNGFEVANGAILMLTEQAAPDNPHVAGGSDAIIAVDPESGRVLWTLPYQFNSVGRVISGDVLLLAWFDTGRLEARDVRTGAIRWQQQHALEEYGLAAALGGETLVLHLKSGVFRELEIATGNTVRERPTVPTATPQHSEEIRRSVVGEDLYLVDGEALIRVPLNGSQATRIELPGLATVIGEPMLCGKDKLCLVVGSSSSQTLRMIDVAAGKELWRSPLPDHSSLSSDGRYLLAAASGGSQLFDLERGAAFARFEDSWANWAGPDRVVLFGSTGIAGVRISTSEVTKFRKGRLGGLCANTDTLIICPTDEGISMWRFVIP